MPLRIEDNELILSRAEGPCPGIGTLDAVDLIVTAAGGDDLQRAGSIDGVNTGPSAAYVVPSSRQPVVFELKAGFARR